MDKINILVSALLSFHILCLLPIFGVVHGFTASSLCAQVPHPELCNSLVETTRDETTLLGLSQSAIRATLDRTQQVNKLVSSMDMNSFDERVRLAWADCVELYADAVNQLNRAASSNNTASTQTWLSAATTNLQTCRNGFVDFNLTSHFQSLLPNISMSSDLSKLLSNSLAINKARPTALDNRRHLLSSDGFPEWVSGASRKLLQSPTAKGDIVVAQDGSGDYMTIAEAVKAARSKQGANKRLVIYVKAGVYKENIVISMNNLMMVGDGIDATVVTGNKNAIDGSTTFGSATFGITGDGFMAKDMTFENTAGPQKHQAVALRSGSDFSVFYGCSFKGYQDTLYVYSMRQFYRNCQIYGTQDFIFGDAVVVLQNCNIYVRKPMSGQRNTVTAQGRNDPNQNTGIVIHNSAVTAGSDLKPVQGSFKTYLGRPWQKYSRTVFMKCSLDGLIDPAGWAPWDGSFALSTLYYGEYMNTGPGASTSGRVNWPGYHVITSAAEAGKFSVGNFLAGDEWIPATGVPFTSGL